MQFYSFAFLVRGGGVYRDELGYHQTLESGDCVFAFPGMRHSYGPVGEGAWSELFVVFNGPVFDLYRQVGLLDRARPVRRLEPVDYWFTRIMDLEETLRAESAAERELATVRFLRLLTEILCESKETPVDWIARARSLLEADVTESRPIEDISRELEVPYETFRKHFQRAAGVSPGRYRALCRIDTARTLLQRTHLSGRQIAESLGFSDEFHFSKRFKQLVGLTPREFRARAG
jgi:AraC-like DNA-binding protein